MERGDSSKEIASKVTIRVIGSKEQSKYLLSDLSLWAEGIVSWRRAFSYQAAFLGM